MIPPALTCDGEGNDEWLQALRVARPSHSLHAGWVSVPSLDEVRSVNGQAFTEVECMEHLGYNDYWDTWRTAPHLCPVCQRIKPCDRHSKDWHAALAELGLYRPSGVCISVGEGQSRLTPKLCARNLIIEMLAKDVCGAVRMSHDVAELWADSFLAPVHDTETPLYTGNADTCDYGMDCAVVFVLGEGSDECSVGCICIGDKD